MQTWPCIVVLVVSAAAVAASDTEERTLRQAIAEANRGMAALSKGNVKKAKTAFTRSLALKPDLPDGHLGLGHIAMTEKRFDDALSSFREAEAGYVNMSALTVELEGERYSRSRDELQRLRAYLAQLDQDLARSQSGIADEAPVGATEGQLERERSQVQARIRSLERMQPPDAGAIRQAPAQIFFFEGNALFNLKRMPDAIAAWEEALRRDAKLPLAENNLAVAYWMTGRLDEARAAMERAQALGFRVNPDFRADLERAIAAKP